MATITIRNLPDDVIERIEERAKANNQSVEDEIRAQLEQCYGPATDKQESPGSKTTTLVDESRQAAALDANSALNVAGDVEDYEFMQRRLELLEGLSRGKRAVLEGRTHSQSEAREKMQRWLKRAPPVKKYPAP